MKKVCFYLIGLSFVALAAFNVNFANQEIKVDFSLKKAKADIKNGKDSEFNGRFMCDCRNHGNECYCQV